MLRHCLNPPFNNLPQAHQATTSQMTILTTTRLRLEPFQDTHLAYLNALSSDPQVMRYLIGKPETIADTAAAITRVKLRWAEWGFSW